MNTKYTAESIKQELWDTLLKLKSKRIRPEVATSVANQARAIMKVVRTEILLAQALAERPDASILPTKFSAKKGVKS